MDIKNSTATPTTTTQSTEDHPCICWSGTVYIGYIELTDENEEVERIEAVPCRGISEEVLANYFRPEVGRAHAEHLHPTV